MLRAGSATSLRHRRHLTAVMLATVICCPALHTDARAQAWVPARGEGAVSIAFQDMRVTKHLAATTSVEAGNIDTNVLLADVTVGLTDRIAVDVALPLVSSKYTGPFPHAGTDIDDGRYRTSFSDVRFALRYNLVREGAVITPYIGSVVPSNNYAYYGHAAPGQQLNEVQVGVYAAKLLESGLPGLFISGRYGFGFVEKVLDISHNRSLGNLEVGYFFNSRFRAFTMANAGLTHGGIDFPSNGMGGLPVEYRPAHDQIQRVNYLEVGLGGAFSMSDSLDVFGSYSTQVAGRNGHSLDRGITVGISWGFRRKTPGESAAATAPSSEAPDAETEKREGSLLRCICQKS
jgi:hypothetical protein